MQKRKLKKEFTELKEEEKEELWLIDKKVNG